MVYDASKSAQDCVTAHGYYVLTADEVQAAIAYPAQQPDPGWCAFLWGFGLTTVVGLYLVSKYVGQVAGFVRSAIR